MKAVTQETKPDSRHTADLSRPWTFWTLRGPGPFFLRSKRACVV